MSETATTQTSDGPVGLRRARRLLRTCVITLFLCVGAYLAGFAAFAIHVAQLSVPEQLQPADGIVVLTGGQSRIDAGVSLLKAGKGKRLLISGVNPVARVDELRVATGGERGLFNCCVDIDRVALNTIGNAEESAKWASANTYRRIIVVTNNYHMPRSLLEMQRILPAVKLQPYPVINTPLHDGAWLANADALRVLVTEYTKYIAALARGFLSALHRDVAFEATAAVTSK